MNWAMLLRRDVILTRAAAAAFGVTVALSLLNGVSEITAAIRGVTAAAAAAVFVPWCLRVLEPPPPR